MNRKQIREERERSAMFGGSWHSATCSGSNASIHNLLPSHVLQDVSARAKSWHLRGHLSR